jgi:hypothetical protein
VPADGRSFTVGLVLANGLGRSFTVPDVCDGWLDVGLVSSTISFDAASEDVGCAGQVIPTGLTRLTRTVQTTYGACSGARDASVTKNFPVCIGPGTDQIPPLPPGIYHLRFDTANIPHAVTPGSVKIILTKP